MNYLDAHPEDAARIAEMANVEPGFAPFVRNGEFGGFVRFSTLGAPAIPQPLTIEDYVVGMELLGNRFVVVKQSDGREALFTGYPEDRRPAAFTRMDMAYRTALGEGRSREVAAFVKGRDGLQ